ncbi:unnamed protein product, partial [Medioppia subpectinata]
MPTTKIYIGNMPEDCKLDQLCQLFGKYGRVEECDIVKNYGFVHMSSDEETKKAIEELNGFEFMGKKLSVEVSRSKVRTKPGMGGKSQCYRCGKSGHWSKECPRNFGERARNTHRHVGRQHHYPYDTNRPFHDTCPPRPPGPPPPAAPLPHRDHYDRLDHYMRDYMDAYERRPPFTDHHIYEGRAPEPLPPPPPEYYRRPPPVMSEPYYDEYYDRRLRDSDTRS